MTSGENTRRRCFRQVFALAAFMTLIGAALAGEVAESSAAKQPVWQYRSGLYAMYPTPDSEEALAAFEQVLAGNPHLTGVLMRAGWAQIEPEEGKYDWDMMDRAVEILRKTGKKYALTDSGARPPDYVYAAGAEKFIYHDNNVHHGDRYLSEQSMPLPWDPVWQKYYEEFLRKVGERYSSDPNCQSILLTCSRTGEMHFPYQPEELAKWKSYDNWDGRIVGAYKKFMDILAEAFPRQQITIHVSQMFNDKDASGRGDERMVEPIIEYGLEKYPERLTLQTCQLAGRREATGGFSYDMVMKYQDRLHNGQQSLASFTTPDRQGSVEMAVLNYLMGGSEYWELWRGDGSDPEFCRQLSEAINKAAMIGAQGYKQYLLDNGLYKRAEDDHYQEQVQALKEAALKEWEAQQQARQAEQPN